MLSQRAQGQKVGDRLFLSTFASLSEQYNKTCVWSGSKKSVHFPGGCKQHYKKERCWEFRGVSSQPTLVERSAVVKTGILISCKRYQRDYRAVWPHDVPSSSPAGSWKHWAPQREECSLDTFLSDHKHQKSYVTSKPCLCVWYCKLDTFGYLLGLLTVVGVNHDRGRHAKTFSLFPQYVDRSRHDTLDPAWNLTPYCHTHS